jgi:hypothetical protein
MNFRAWWRRRPLASAPRAADPPVASAEVARLERLAEQAYAAMYVVAPMS